MYVPVYPVYVSACTPVCTCIIGTYTYVVQYYLFFAQVDPNFQCSPVMSMHMMTKWNIVYNLPPTFAIDWCAAKS